MSNYRDRILVDLCTIDRINYISSYKDEITNIKLLSVINDFILLIHKLTIRDCIHAIFQKSYDSDQYGIILTVKSTYDLIQMELLQKELKLHIFAINLYNPIKPKNNDQLTYITDNKYFNRFDWLYSMDGFSQIYGQLSLFIHNQISELIQDSKCCNYIGLGGESLSYSKYFKFKKVICLTDCIGVHTSNLENLKKYPSNNYLVDYQNLKLENYVSHKNNLLLINISRKGLRQLTQQIDINSYPELIYISCCEKSLNIDLKVLSFNYKIIFKRRLQMFPNDTKNIMHIIKLISNLKT